MAGRCFLNFRKSSCRHAIFWLCLICGWLADSAPAAAASPADPAGILATNAAHGYNVNAFTIEGRWVLSTNTLVRLFSKYAGTNVSMSEIVCAASDLELEYLHEGYPTMNIVIAPKQIRNGVVTFDVFPGAVAQIVVAGNRYLVVSTNGVETVVNPPEPAPATAQAAATTNAPAAAGRVEPKFSVEKYGVMGNTLLPPADIARALTNVPAAFGTNVTISAIRSLVANLQGAYRERGYVTVAVSVPSGQKLSTNHPTVKLLVTEGLLTAINVKGNRYFSTEDVMRSLPSLHTNIMLNGLIFQAELNRANGNQDRQIYPVIGPGPDPGTSELTLEVKDRLPLHGKIVFNNESSPGTPDLRLNASAVYNNVWDLEHSLGVQYSFSPLDFKTGSEWNFYDQPLVANYSAFYRMPLGTPEALDDVIANSSGNFGYSEATRKFNLPPASGQPELNVYASRSTIDTGLATLSSSTLYSVPGVITVNQDTVQQDLTVNNDIGARLSSPLPAAGDIRQDISGGLDFKTYQATSYKTNNFNFAEITVNALGIPNPPIYSTVASPVPTTDHLFEYIPLAVSYNGSWHMSKSTLAWGLGISANLWHSGSRTNLQQITGSSKSTGRWFVFTPSLSWQIPIHTNWLTTVRMDGQWATEPLISNEQFGAGGVNSVRGYQEGQVFGDTGWHGTLEQLTPPHTVGMIDGRFPLILRGTIYMDYAQTYLLDPQGRTDHVDLWGTGVGCVASIGSFWETRFLFSVPLLATSTTGAYTPFFNFALTAEF